MQKLKTNQKERGAILIAVTSYSMILSIMVLSTIALVRNMGQNEQAFLIDTQLSQAAESGLSMGAALVSRQNSFAISNSDLFSDSPVSLNGISVIVSSTPSATDEALITARATSTQGNMSKTISFRLARGAGSATVLKELDGTGVFSAGDINFVGTVFSDVLTQDGKMGLMYTLTNANIAWDGHISNGSLKAVKNITLANPGCGIDTQSHVAAKPFPTCPVIDIDAYKTLAQKNKMVFNTVAKAMDSVRADGTVPGGVIYITGNASTKDFPWDKLTLKGMIVADGDITIEKDRTIQNPTPNSFCAISRNGSVTVSGSGTTLNGSIYAPKGPVTFLNDRSINGHIISDGDIGLIGNASVATGLMFSNNGSVTITNSCRSIGQIVAKTGLTMSGAPLYNYKYPTGGYVLENAVVKGGVEPTIVANSWNEINN